MGEDQTGKFAAWSRRWGKEPATKSDMVMRLKFNVDLWHGVLRIRLMLDFFDFRKHDSRFGKNYISNGAGYGI